MHAAAPTKTVKDSDTRVKTDDTTVRNLFLKLAEYERRGCKSGAAETRAAIADRMFELTAQPITA